MKVIIFLGEEKFNRLNPIDGNYELDLTMGLPFLENNFEIEDLKVYGNEMKFTQNNIRYYIYKRESTVIDDSFRGHRSNMVYIDKDLELNDKMLFTKVYGMNIENRLPFKNKNCFTNKCDIRYTDFIKFI